MCDELKILLKRDSINGLCHGTRNGYEQNYIASIDGYNAIGTDISPTAKDYQNSVQWDFHEINKEWIGKFDFVYSNSLDQSWDPKLALSVWLKQVKQGGFVVIEHTHAHSPTGAGEMDPFGVRPTVFPYVIADWFDLDVSIKFIKSTKQNDLEVWLFFIKNLK